MMLDAGFNQRTERSTAPESGEFFLREKVYIRG
jgi:hypothetical protein